MDKTAKQIIGQKGETAACVDLEKRGFEIVARNYWKPWGEIDLIARRGSELRFVEVKTVTRNFITEEDYEPEDNIHPWKRRRLRRVIETYLLAEPWADELNWQVDAVCVYLDGEGKVWKIDWLEDVIL